MSQTLTVAPWRLFAVEVRAVHRLSPSFLRVTFTGPDLDRFADNGHDQRVKLVLPIPRHGLDHLPTGPDWHQRWRALPDELRNPIRTYTVRAVRAELREVDIDFVLHGDGGPASRWAGDARPGDQVAILGPDAGFDGEHGGVEFRPPARSGPLLLAGDETAVPAIAAILQRLPLTARGKALLEVPDGTDALPLAAPPGMTVTWLARDHAGHGKRLIPAVVAAADRLVPAVAAGTSRLLPAAGTSRSADLTDVDVDREILWEVPDPAQSEAPEAATTPYAWLAGEAGVIKTLRQHLVGERGFDRRSVAFMGYWRLGRSDNGRA
ncbi:MAG TPA: siderophore-interacting protein [Micromonospora sp.]|nr:siderophore-interacting protein [Micromonospora sp.]